MKRRETGKYVIISTVGEKCQAFVPDPLPPKNPPLDVTGTARGQMDEALMALGRLDGLTQVLPDPWIFLYIYIRKEAVLSSQIEGTQSSLSDLLQFEIQEFPGVPVDDVLEVSNYVAAMDHGLKRLNEGFPLTNRLLREIHGVLLSKGRGSDKNHGEFRRSQNWIGGTRPGNARFVPPPPERLDDCMGELEKFLNNVPEPVPILIKAALAHAQFETIHPFLDGNGRIGRLLITFIFCSEKVLKQPLLYISLYFKRHRQQYYDLLQNIREYGQWEEWLQFFVDAVLEIANQAVNTASSLLRLFADDRETLRGRKDLSSSVYQVYEQLCKKPLITIGKMAESTGLTIPTVTTALHRLEEIGIVEEFTKRRRGRIYAYKKYLVILNEGTENSS